MIAIPNPQKEIPERVKLHNGALHNLAMSDDPVIKCENVRKLVMNLKATLQLGGVIDTGMVDPEFGFPTTLDKFFNYQLKGANESVRDYTLGLTGQAIEKADAVLSSILFILYDDRFVTQDTTTSFTGPVNR